MAVAFQRVGKAGSSLWDTGPVWGNSCFFRERVSFAAVGVCELPQTGERLEMRGIVRGVGSLKTHLLFLLLHASLQAFPEDKTPFLVQGVAPLPRLMRPPFRS